MMLVMAHGGDGELDETTPPISVERVKHWKCLYSLVPWGIRYMIKKLEKGGYSIEVGVGARDRVLYCTSTL
jgi:hypothetical protein